MRGPGVIAEIAVRGAGGDDEMVVGDIAIAIHPHIASGDIDAGDFAHQHRDVFLFVENMPDRRGNRRCRQARRRHLIQQRLKQMVIAAIDHRDLQRLAGKRLDRFVSAEAAADDDDAWVRRWIHTGEFNVSAIMPDEHKCE